MSKLSKIVKDGIKNLLETKGFEDMEVAFGVKHKNDNLSDAEKNQFGPMGQLKTSEGGSFTNPKVPGTREVEKANTKGGSDAQAYYKEVAKKVKDYQTPNDKENFKAPKVPTNTDGENQRLKTTGYDVGVSGMEVVADLAAKEGGTEEGKKAYKDRVEKLNGNDATYQKLAKNADDTNELKYSKDARNTRPAKAQKSKQPEQPEKKNESFEYKGVDTNNIFKVKGKIVSEEQVLKLVNKVPSRVKVNETTFAITDGENTYRLIWEGDSKNGEAIITNYKNTELVKEDIQKMKYLWGFKPEKPKQIVKEDAKDSFMKMFKTIKESK
jgi:hypothetical protein